LAFPVPLPKSTFTKRQEKERTNSIPLPALGVFFFQAWTNLRLSGKRESVEEGFPVKRFQSEDDRKKKFRRGAQTFAWPAGFDAQTSIVTS